MKKDPGGKVTSLNGQEDSTDLEKGESQQRRDSVDDDFDQKGRDEMERNVGKLQEKAAGKGLGEPDAADGKGAVTTLQGGEKIETLFGKIFISLNFFQNFGLVGLMDLPWPVR